VDDGRSVTVLLRAWRDGRHLRGESPGHTFRPTELVSEAYLRLSSGASPACNDRIHFFAVAARNMRQILIDHARKRAAGKRGDGARPLTFDDQLIAGERPEELLALDEGLVALAAFDPRKARAIELHYFAGLVHAEIAEILEVHLNTVMRDLRLGEAWLHRYLATTG
jgi:RNA polymerase sigma factor (TIGR02999 family)